MHLPMQQLPIVEDYEDGFCSRLTEWGGMIVVAKNMAAAQATR